jgi:hypothetical protein
MHDRLEGIDLVSEAIKFLWYKTLKYIKVDPYVHPN